MKVFFLILVLVLSPLFSLEVIAENQVYEWNTQLFIQAISSEGKYDPNLVIEDQTSALAKVHKQAIEEVARALDVGVTTIVKSIVFTKNYHFNNNSSHKWEVALTGKDGDKVLATKTSVLDSSEDPRNDLIKKLRKDMIREKFRSVLKKKIDER